MANTSILGLPDDGYPLYTFLSDNGASSGNKQMIGDYSVTPGHFYYAAPERFSVVLTDVTILIRDRGTLDAGHYGNNIQLTNGIRVVLSTGSDLNAVSTEFTPAGMEVKTNADWAMFGGEIFHSDFGSGDNYVTAHYLLTSPLILHGQHTDAFGLILQDDMSNLVAHTAFISGWMFEA